MARASHCVPDITGSVWADTGEPVKGFQRLDPIQPRHGGVSSCRRHHVRTCEDFLERLAFTVAFVVVGLAIPYLTGINESWAIPIVAGLQIIRTFSRSGSAIPTPRALPIPRHCPCHRRNYQLRPPTRRRGQRRSGDYS